MNIGKFIHFLRRSKRLNWHGGQLLSQEADQHGYKKIVEYQDRWTKTPSRVQIWFHGGENHTEYTNARSPW